MSGKKTRAGGTVTAPEPARQANEVADARTALKAAGAAQAFRVTSTFTNASLLMAMKAVKDAKAYQALGLTWDEYCSSQVGINRGAIDEGIANLESFGAEFLGLGADIGLGRAVYRMLRSLPPEQRPKVLPSGDVEIGGEVIPTQDRDRLADYLENITAERRELQQQIDRGKEQLRELEVAAEAKDRQRLEERQELEEKLELARKGRVKTEVDRLFLQVLSNFTEIWEAILNEDPGSEPANIKRHIGIISGRFDDLAAYGSGRYQVHLPPEGMDPIEAERMARQMDREEEGLE